MYFQDLGLVDSLVGPVELIRIRLQTQPVEKKIYSGPIDCIRQIYRAGGIRALYRGLGATVAREGHGMGYLQIFSNHMLIPECISLRTNH